MKISEFYFSAYLTFSSIRILISKIDDIRNKILFQNPCKNVVNLQVTLLLKYQIFLKSQGQSLRHVLVYHPQSLANLYDKSYHQ